VSADNFAYRLNLLAMQCRVTTENPAHDFRPDTGTIDVFRMPCGFGIRLDDGPGFPGAKITPHYDSLLVKITAKARDRKDASAKLIRALREFRVRGVQTNKSFLLNVLNNKSFLEGEVTTGFIAANPELMSPLKEKDRAQKLLQYIGEVLVNGTPKSLGATGDPPSLVDPIVPQIDMVQEKNKSLKQIFDEEGPDAFAKAVRDNKGLLITDTTWRDAVSSLIST
jgi:pyruvate carboxylase